MYFIEEFKMYSVYVYGCMVYGVFMAYMCACHPSREGSKSQRVLNAITYVISETMESDKTPAHLFI